MKASNSLFILTAALVGATTVAAQETQVASRDDAKPAATADSTTSTTRADSARADSAAKAPAPKPLLVQEITIQRYRPTDQRGINMFETPKTDAVPFTGFRLGLGASFTQQFQSLEHSNAAAPKLAKDAAGKEYDANALIPIGGGFNNAVANLYVNAQLAPGIRVALTSCLSARHHQETWVKDGYILIDDSPFDVAALDELMQYLTLRVGHMEINYGDQHFRRTDNGNAIYNPFVGNTLMDAFTTEIGAEAYLRAKGFMVMGGVFNGESRGMVTRPGERSYAYLGKAGYDRQMSENLRVRLTGSYFTQDKSTNQTLFSGDRAGSRYYLVMENPVATEKDNFTSGTINPSFRNKIAAYQINPFVKVGGLELFGILEQTNGRSNGEAKDRTWDHYSAEAVYRFLKDDKLFVGARYNTAEGELAGITNTVGATRSQIGGGWFVTPSLMLKAEYVTQKYNDFPTTDIRNKAKFNGLMMEGVVSF